MPGFPLGGFGAIGSGWAQGQQAAQYQQQQMQMRQFEQQMQVMQMLQQLQQQQAYQRALQGLPPEEQRDISLGETPSQYETGQRDKQKYADTRAAAIAGAQRTISALESRMADPQLSATDRARVFNIIQSIRDNPMAAGDPSKLLGEAGIGSQKIPGGIYAGAYMSYLQAHPGDVAGAGRAASQAEISARIAARPITNVNVETPVPPTDLLPNPADPTGKTSILVQHSKSGAITTTPVPVPVPTKGKSATAATPTEIGTALDQMQGMIPMLRQKPGVVSGGISQLRGMSKAYGGYPDEGAFMNSAGALSDMIPKALSGRANQSSINNAMRTMVPSFHDTQASAQRKIDQLRQLFNTYGVLPSGGSSPAPPPGFE